LPTQHVLTSYVSATKHGNVNTHEAIQLWSTAAVLHATKCVRRLTHGTQKHESHNRQWRMAM